MKILFISDIHGININLKKIEKVIEKEKIDKLVVLGDLYYAGPTYNQKYEVNSMNVKDTLTKYSDKIICLKGNCDSDVDIKDESDYPIYQTTSCALAVALSKPDRKFFYNSDICKCNKCPNYQRNLCKKKNDNLKMVSKNDVKKLIKKLGKEIDLKDIELKYNMIILRNIILSLNEISYITEILQHQVLVMKKEDDYYWNTSINNSSILKV